MYGKMVLNCMLKPACRKIGFLYTIYVAVKLTCTLLRLIAVKLIHCKISREILY